MNLSGLTALVTGGASGLGNETVHGLVTAGANIVVVDLPDTGGEEQVRELGGSAVFCPADVRSAADVQDAVDLAVDRFGGLHAAINCAGIAPAARTVGRKGPHDLDLFRRAVEINLIGTFNVARLAAARMATQEPVDGERGVIINTASIAAFEGQIGQTAYASSKGGVVALTLPMARDLARSAIRVVTIAPGTFDTPMLAGLPQEARAALAEGIPHPHRLGDPADFALLVRQVLHNPYLNGEVIRLDGALRMSAR